MISSEDIVNLVQSKLSSFLPLAESLGKSRFLVYKSEYGKNDKEAETMDTIADSFRADIVKEGNSLTLKFFMDENDPGGYLQIIDAGMPTPELGGSGTPGNRIAHNPDGSTYKSNVPIQFWGQSANNPEDLAKPASGVINEIHTMLAGLFRQHIQEAISETKKELLDSMKKEVIERIGVSS